MSWIHKNAINRTFNAFKRNKDKVYKEDIDALKTLNDLVENGHQKTVTENVLFAKLLCFCLNRMLLHYEDINQAIKECDFELSKSLNIQVAELQYSLNKLEELQRAKNLNSTSDLKDINKEKWSLNVVYSSFIATCNEFINDIKHYG
jgi:hypothetical protein